VSIDFVFPMKQHFVCMEQSTGGPWTFSTGGL
jgi:hypothetical protein